MAQLRALSEAFNPLPFNQQDMRDSEAAFEAMDASETPGTRASVDRCELKADLKV